MTKSKLIKILLVFSPCLLFNDGCAHDKPNPYETAPPAVIKRFKSVHLPFAPGTRFTVAQGAFAKTADGEPPERGNEYTWDFAVPYGTRVLSVEDGAVLDVWEPGGVGGCNKDLRDTANNIKIEHRDGTVAEYVHVKSLVQMGDHVKKGKVIAVTEKNGYLCRPLLHFGVFHSDKELDDSPDRHTVPLLFLGLGNGVLKAKNQYTAP